MTFDGEWIIAAWTGRTLVALAFTSAVVSGISFLRVGRNLAERLSTHM